jgi:hypothetical protein
MQAILRFPCFFKVDAFQELTDEINDVVSLSYTIVFYLHVAAIIKREEDKNTE